MMPLIKCCAASPGGLTAKMASVAKGIRQTASQRMMNGLDMVCNGQNKDDGKKQVGSLIGTGEDFKRMGRSSENLSLSFFKT